MKDLRGHPVVLALAVLIFSESFSRALQYYDLIGLPALHQGTTNVNGTGIPVGQPEATQGGTPPRFEVDPMYPGHYSPGFYTYISAFGTTNVFPNSVGTNSDHAVNVANVFYGLPNGMATNVLHVNNYDADYYIDDLLSSNVFEPDIVVNQSFSFGTLPANQQKMVDLMYDHYEETYKTFFVSAANNLDPANGQINVAAPGTAYNCISVGAYPAPVIFGGIPTNANCIGPTLDNGRCKPDITAVDIFTSGSTPEVAGAAADLMQAALRGDGGSDTNSAFNLRTIKALLINGAVKPLGWTNSSLFPLDARYGSGIVNVYNSYVQLTGGKNSAIVSQSVSAGSQHPPTGAAGTEPVLTGWDFTTNNSTSSQDAVSHYYFNVSNNIPGTRFTASATLVWNRHLNQNNINNLDLFLYNCANSNLVNCSTSLVNNVEYIYQTNLAPGRYDLQVWKQGNPGMVSSSESYALAFTFYSARLSASGPATNLTLSWPAYPQGFMVQATTDLGAPNWNGTNLPTSTIINSRNILQLGATNGVQFFRLFSPNL